MIFQFQYKDTVVIIEYKIQEEVYKIGKTSFKTDKYIDALTWCSIMERIDKILKKIFEGSLDWKSLQGELEPMQTPIRYKITYKFVPKEKTRLDLQKITYELDWFLTVKIRKDLEQRVTRSSSLKASSTSSTKPTYSNEFESFVGSSQAKSESQVILINSQDSDIENPKKAKVRKANSAADSTCTPFKPRTSDENIKEELPQSSRKSVRHIISSDSSEEAKPEKKRSKVDKSKTPLKKTNTVYGWLSGKDAKDMSEQNVTKRKKPKKIIEASPDKAKSQPTPPIMDAAQREKLEVFLEQQKEKEAASEKRKEELKDLEILSCNNITDEELRETVNKHKNEILTLFATPHRSRSMPIIDHLKYDPLMLTTAGIFSSNQQLNLLNYIEKVRPIDERGMRDDILHEVVLPYITCHIFKEMHNFPSIKDAYERIEHQEEKKKLIGYVAEDDNLYDSR